MHLVIVIIIEMNWDFITSAYRCPHQLRSFRASYIHFQEKSNTLRNKRTIHVVWERNHLFFLEILLDDNLQGSSVVRIEDGLYFSQKGEDIQRLSAVQIENQQGLNDLCIPDHYLEPNLANVYFQRQMFCRTKDLVTQAYIVKTEECLYLDRLALKIHAQPIPSLLYGSVSDDLLGESTSCLYIIDRETGITLLRQLKNNQGHLDGFNIIEFDYSDK